MVVSVSFEVVDTSCRSGKEPKPKQDATQKKALRSCQRSARPRRTSGPIDEFSLPWHFDDGPTLRRREGSGGLKITDCYPGADILPSCQDLLNQSTNTRV
jgi:hypothetical protein